MREEVALQRADRYLFTDTNAITTAVFSNYYHGAVAPELRSHCAGAVIGYDVVFLCDAEIPYEDTADRSGEGNRRDSQEATAALLDPLGIQYCVVTGALDARIGQVNKVLRTFSKWSC